MSKVTKLPARAMSKFAEDRHRSAAVMLGHALTLNDEATWWQTCAVWYARLTREERAALGFFALMAMSEDDAALTAAHAIHGGVIQ